MIRRQKDGRDVYTWKSNEPHDMLDAVAQAYAIAASQGISGININGTNPAPRLRTRRPRIRVV